MSARSFEVLPTPDAVAGPTFRYAGGAGDAARRDWRWVAALRTRATLETGHRHTRMALVERVERAVYLDPVTGAPFPAGATLPADVITAVGNQVHAIDTFDPSHLAAVWKARAAAGLPVPPRIEVEPDRFEAAGEHRAPRFLEAAR